jgi:hypothetical protein
LKYTTPTLLHCLCLLLISGCIQNPGPDKELRHGINHSSVRAFYPNGALEFTLRLELDKTHLEVRNVGKVRLDSAVYLLQVNQGPSRPDFSRGFSPFPEVQRYGRFGALEPGESRKLGNVQLSTFVRISDFAVAAEVLVSYRDGERYGDPLAGFYTGSYRTMDSAVGSESGEMHGLINAEGRYVFWFSPVVSSFPPPQTSISGKLLVGDLVSESVLHTLEFFHPKPPGTYLPDEGFGGAGGNVSASFHAQDESGPVDSLDLTLKLGEPG